MADTTDPDDPCPGCGHKVVAHLMDEGCLECACVRKPSELYGS